jgi:hypothetical protein
LIFERRFEFRAGEFNQILPVHIGRSASKPILVFTHDLQESIAGPILEVGRRGIEKCQ